MLVDMKMPDLSTTEEDIVVVRWLVEVGGRVERGRPLLEVRTDKATMEVDSFVTGVLREVLAGPDAKVEAGQVIGRVEAEGAAAAGAAARPPSEARATRPPAASIAPAEAAPAARTGMFARNRQRAARQARMPRAKSSGAAPPASAAPLSPPQVAPLDAADAAALSPVQRTVARRMQQSKQTAPHFYLLTSANAEPMLACRDAAGPEQAAWEALLVWAAARAMRRFPRMAARFQDDRLVRPSTDAIGVAVDLGGDLFVVPVAGAADKNPMDISREIREGVDRLRSGDRAARRLQPAVLTVTHLVDSAVEAFVPILNPPESAVLAAGKVGPQVVAADGKIVVQRRIGLALAADHRVVGGRYAADFLGAIVAELEAL